MTHNINGHQIYIAFSRSIIDNKYRVCTCPLILTKAKSSYYAQLLRDVDFSLLITKDEKIKFRFLAVQTDGIKQTLKNKLNLEKFRINHILEEYLNTDTSKLSHIQNYIKNLYTFNFNNQNIVKSNKRISYVDKHNTINNEFIYNLFEDKLPFEIIKKILSYVSGEVELRLFLAPYKRYIEPINYYYKNESKTDTDTDTDNYQLFISNPFFKIPNCIVRNIK